jgi:subtilisin family serine protease
VIWAVDHGAQIINLSLGGTGESAILEDAINYAYNRGSVIVAAAGNGGSNFVLYPARYPNVIAVASTNGSNKWAGSNYGPEIDLAAPGALIYSTVVGGYGYKSGSSMATGFVSGLAAILMDLPGNASPHLIESQLESTALDIEFTGWDDYTGAGLIQMDAAINLALQSVQPSTETNIPPFGSGPGSIEIGVTNTPILTWTPLLTPSTQEPTAPFPSVTGTTESVVETMSSPPSTSVEEKSEVEAQQGSEISFYILPCTGILLILLGIALVWVFRRKQQEL